MSCSKKDGAKGGGHRRSQHTFKYPKWRRNRDVRRERHSVEYHHNMLLGEEIAEQQADFDLLKDYEEHWDWEQDYIDWHAHDEGYWGAWPDEMNGEYDYITDRYAGADVETRYNMFEDDWYDLDAELTESYNPHTDLFLAVDRAVRRYGVEETLQYSFMLATALDVSRQEIERCIRLTPAGYVRRA
jgi:hypothetical protein